MTNSQRTVLWLGLILVALNLFMKWSAIKAVIFSGAGLTSSSSSGAANPNVPAPGAKLPNPQPNVSPTPTPSTTAVIL